jgi:undecaprenyl diphosphate synthase
VICYTAAIMSEISNTIPQTVGIILDGNRRWAQEYGLPIIDGHRRGVETLEECVAWVRDAGIRNLIVYGFSTENWKRSEEEVSDLMELVTFFSGAIKKRAIKEGIKVHFIGMRDRLPEHTRVAIDTLEHDTAQGKCVTLVVALSYGGRAEIVEAARSLSESERAALTEESFAEKLWTAGIPDPDIIIRTGGQQRLSNFLPWQSVYSELFFTATYWPAFTHEEFDDILATYGTRVINKGK